MTIAEQAYVQLRQLVLEGEFEPGQRLSQLKIARRFGCTTPPVVEAMRRLESDGLLVKESRKMARVRALSPEDIEGLYLVREGLEGVTARLCAQRADAKQFKRLAELNRQYEAAVDAQNHDETARLDIAIHKLIARAASCNLVEQELNRLLAIELTAGKLAPTQPAAAMSHSRHRGLIQAITDRDADAAEYLMKKHIQLGYADIQRAMEASS
jgi:DNA-binding GntR family transcriptional regulator